MSRTQSSRAVDLIDDVVVELSARRSRTALIVAAVALSTGALLASLGISSTAAQQIASSLAASTLDLVTVEVNPVETSSDDAQTATGGAPASYFPADTQARAESVTLVEAAGLSIAVDRNETTAVRRPGDPQEIQVPVLGATPGFMNANEAAQQSTTTWLLETDQHVVLLGTSAAAELSIPISPNPTGHQIQIGPTLYQVIGFIDSGRIDLGAYAVIPYGLAVDAMRSDASSSLLVRTAPGAGAPVAGVIRTAIRPDQPERLANSQVTNLSALRQGVDTQLGQFAAWIGAFLLVLTCLLIANSMIVSVVARTAEIGLRRALGASRAAVSAVFWGEGLVIGLVGGITGSAVGAVAVVAVSTANQWTAHLDPWTFLYGPALGGLTGLLASAYPAWNVTRISPALAVRSD
ncbi:ABC transporter permease [Sanguibacter suarezii]|uniref:ABC transporter permease n=1 Tax=Sanguibacter suarezii TaxID=60921 RepID=UPI000830E756|nr:ABC transporter permease [Sanguibacter suarezii]